VVIHAAYRVRPRGPRGCRVVHPRQPSMVSHLRRIVLALRLSWFHFCGVRIVVRTRTPIGNARGVISWVRARIVVRAVMHRVALAASCCPRPRGFRCTRINRHAPSFSAVG
jgi:hypothetical protein